MQTGSSIRRSLLSLRHDGGGARRAAAASSSSAAGPAGGGNNALRTTTAQRRKCSEKPAFGRHHHQQHRRTFLSAKLRTVLRNVFSGDDHTNPKKLLERRYAYYALLAMRFRALRLGHGSDERGSADGGTSSSGTGNADDDLYGRAVRELEEKDLDKMRNAHLRLELQEALRPQVVEIFSAFERVDGRLGISGVLAGGAQGEEGGHDDDDERRRRQDAEDRRPFFGWNWDPYLSILGEEHAKACADLEDHRRRGSSEGSGTRGGGRDGGGESNDCATSRTIAFLEHKRGALETLLRFHERGEFSEAATNNADDNLLDFFGIDVRNTDPQNLELIRRYQTVNLARSALIRDEVGYSVVCLRSSIPNARRGLFVDGSALAGSLLAFLPGEIWPKEHLMTKSADVVQHFDDGDDEGCQVTLRFDDYVVDSRESPVTVLSREGSMNPWALGHMVNHPPPQTLPNCQSTMLNYTEEMDLGPLVGYVPNTYARRPGWQSRMFDSEAVLMHGMGILSRRDVSSEELVYDYRLQAETSPFEWYSAVDYGERGSEHMMDKEQVVFFRDDWMDK